MTDCSMTKPVITFLMVVVDPDVVIADYAIKSFKKIKGIPFQLRVYSNWVTIPFRKRYFPTWRRYPFVELIENEWQKEEDRPSEPWLAGPFEYPWTIFDPELPKIETSYFATVDADFEILDPTFLYVMLERLGVNQNLIGISTDYSGRRPEYYDTYSEEVICLNERWKPWFCIYKKAALRCEVSHGYYEKYDPILKRRSVWDGSARYQQALREQYGYDFEVLDAKYRHCYIHYGAFAKNRDINKHNVALYRWLQLLAKKGFFERRQSTAATLARHLTQIIFRGADRSRFLDGWNPVKK